MKNKEGLSKPESVQPGQMWKNNDPRSDDSPFVIAAMIKSGSLEFDPDYRFNEDLAKRLKNVPAEGDWAVTHRDDGRFVRIRADRLMMYSKNRGYTYLGRSK